MTALIERGAIALLREDDPLLEWATIPHFSRERLLRESRACLEAFAEPTVTMECAGDEAWNEEKPSGYIYRVMVTAELDEKEPTDA